MSEAEWKILFYTWDDYGNIVRIVDEVTRDKEGGAKKVVGGWSCEDRFPDRMKHRLFDVKLPDGRIFEKCLLVPIKIDTFVRAVMQDGSFMELEHGTELRVVHDIEAEKMLKKIAHKIRMEEGRQEKIKSLGYEKADLEKKLEEVNAELKRLEKK